MHGLLSLAEGLPLHLPEVRRVTCKGACQPGLEDLPQSANGAPYVQALSAHERWRRRTEHLMRHCGAVGREGVRTVSSAWQEAGVTAAATVHQH